MQPFLESLRKRQKNLTWPDPLVNSRLVDVFFLKGSPHPIPAQRIAAWLLGIGFLQFGLIFVSVAKGEDSILWLLAGYGLIALGVVIFRNGFQHRAQLAKDDSREDHGENS